jgi:hypothetical protein
MREARPVRCASQGRAGTLVKAVYLFDAKQGGFSSQGREDAPGTAGRMREARPFICSSLGRADARSKARHIR